MNINNLTVNPKMLTIDDLRKIRNRKRNKYDQGFLDGVMLMMKFLIMIRINSNVFFSLKEYYKPTKGVKK